MVCAGHRCGGTGQRGQPAGGQPRLPLRPGIGAPVPDPAGILDLPAGFSYQVVSRAGDPLPGGGITPGRHDGTATFDGPHGGLRLVQNHEIGAMRTRPWPHRS